MLRQQANASRSTAHARSTTAAAAKKCAPIIDLCDSSDDISTIDDDQDLIDLSSLDEHEGRASIPAAVPGAARNNNASFFPRNSAAKKDPPGSSLSPAKKVPPFGSAATKDPPSPDDANNPQSKGPTRHAKRARETSPIFFTADIFDIDGAETTTNVTLVDNRKKPPPSSSSDDAVEIVAVKKTDMGHILEIFPDIQVEYAKKLLKDMGGMLDRTLSVLSEGKYPRRSDGTPASVGGGGLTLTFKRPPPPKYDYLAPSSFAPSTEYQEQANTQLLYDFPFLSCNGVTKMLKETGGHYSIARERILDSVMGKSVKKQAKGPVVASVVMVLPEDEEEQYYTALKHVLAGGPLDTRQQSRLGKDNLLKKRRTISKMVTSITDEILKEEVSFARQKLSQWMASVEKKIQLKSARTRAQAAGTAIECTCCCEKVCVEEMTHCNAGHMLCMDCLRSYAEHQIFGSGNFGVDRETKKPALDLKCCHGDGCNASFPERFLQITLTEKALEKYNELQFSISVEKAGLKEEMRSVAVSLWIQALSFLLLCVARCPSKPSLTLPCLCPIFDHSSCPKCGFQAHVPDTQMVFECPMSTCLFHSCRKCQQESHIPLRCEEVAKQKKQDEGRLEVEEAITEAKIRTCPKCSARFIKSDGCNKMTCSCGAKVCYVCRKDISNEGYQHFCQTPHCAHASCGKCILYSNAEEDDERAMREAGITAAQRYEEQLRSENSTAAATTTTNHTGVHIDVEGILKKPGAIGTTPNRSKKRLR
jgi:E3 ubiquitin-protein ligase RNF216